MTEPRPQSEHGELRWHRLYLSAPIAPARSAAVLRSWAANNRGRRIVLECRASGGKVRYLLGTKAPAVDEVIGVLNSLIGGTITIEGAERHPIQTAGRVKASTRHRAINTEPHRFELASRSLLGALTRAGEDEELVIQIVLGPPRVPLAVPNQSPSSLVSPWYQVAWRGNGGVVDPEKRAALRAKVSDHGFACSVRLGVHAATPERRRALLLGLMAAIRTGETSGLQLRLAPDAPRNLDTAGMPNWHWPLRLNVSELTTLTGWPLEADDLPGATGVAPQATRSGTGPGAVRPAHRGCNRTRTRPGVVPLREGRTPPHARCRTDGRRQVRSTGQPDHPRHGRWPRRRPHRAERRPRR